MSPYRPVLRTILAALAAVLALLPLAASATAYRLDTGDKVRVYVDEWPALTGEFTVNPARSLSLPLVGEIQAGGLTPQELAQAISAAVARTRSLPARPTAMVDVMIYRPFFIQGDVQRPGEFPYRPNLTVQQAISIAGGFYRPQDAGTMRFERDAIESRGELKILADKLGHLQIREARLDAERRGQDTFTLPPAMAGRSIDPVVGKMLEEETHILRTRNAAFRTQLDLVKRLQGLYEKEIESLRLQIASEDRQLKSTQNEAATIAKLADRGLAASPRQWTIERTIAQIMSTRQSLETTILRTQQQIVLAEEKSLALRTERSARISEEIRLVLSEAAEAREKIELTRDLLAEAEQLGPAALSERVLRRGWKVTTVILRRGEDSTARTIAANPMDRVEPGDVVVVERTPPAPPIR